MLGYCYCFSPATITGTLSFTFREATALARSGISYCSGNARKVVDALCRAGEWLRLPGRCFVLDKAVWCIVREVDVDICRDGELLQVLVGEFSPDEVIRDRCHNRRLGGRQARGVGSFTLLAAVQVDPAFVGVPVRQGRRGQCPDPLGRTRRRHVVVRVPERIVQRCLGRRALGLHPLWLAVACGGGDERVRHELLRRGPVPSASPEAPGQEVLGLRGQPRRHLRQGVRVPDPVDGGEDVVHVAPRRASGGHLDHRAPQGPDVGGRALLLPVRHLRRHERRRAADRPRGFDGLRAVEVCEPGAVRNRTLTLIEREYDTRSWINFLVYFSHSTTMSCAPRGWGYILIDC
jgi:hypothetical protein